MQVDAKGIEASGGLDPARVAAARALHGWNELPRLPPPSRLAVLLRQFNSLLVLLLAGAAVLAATIGEWVDTAALVLVLVLNAVLGFLQEWRAETALDALRAMLSRMAVVIRDGRQVEIPARELVPGDLVVVPAGATVPADISLLAAVGASADESALTGESLPVDKLAGAGGDGGMLFAGTTLVAGRARGVVTAIGSATRFGEVATLTGDVVETRTRLQERLAQLSRTLAAASLIVAGGIIALGLWLGRPLFETFMMGLSLAVAMIPEGLPAVVTVTLALGVSAMAAKSALARRLQAIETLGAASVICTDKTGTLTENQMTATRIWTPDRLYEATGTGRDPAGHIASEGGKVRAEDDPRLALILETALTCTHATLERDGEGWSLVGAPTEGALVTLAYKGWAPLPAPDAVVAEAPFTSERKRMSVLARTSGGLRLFAKGAPEVILGRCVAQMTADGPRPLDPTAQTRIVAAYEDMAAAGQRVLALATREASEDDPRERDLTLLALVGMIDPPRAEVPDAIAGAKAAGLRVMMITGDSALTAAAIAEEVGLGRPRILDGAEIDRLSDAELAGLLCGDVAFARTHPEHKLRIVRALQANGAIVGMTGDGVNDAPALRQADIGIAMGQRGTDVAREAADLVLLDDNFATIVTAIAEGRRQFDNIRKFVRYLLASNAGEVVAIVVNLSLGGPLIFLATQILWMNLITDGATAVALGLERGEAGQMRRPPRPRDAAILGRPGLLLVGVFGLYTGTASLWLFYTLLPLGPEFARTAAFTGMVVFEKASVFAFRSLTQPVTAIGWLSNRVLIVALCASLGLQVLAVYWSPLGTLLGTVPIGAAQWGLIAALALPLVVVPELVKAVRQARSPAG